MPCLAASRYTRTFSLTPARRQASGLADADRPRGEQLLEHDPVVDVLAGGDAHRRHGAGDRGVARGCRRGWSAPRSSTGRSGELAHHLDRLRRPPRPGWRRASAARPAPISSRSISARGAGRRRGSPPTLSLKWCQPSASALPDALADALVVVAEPARGGDVRGIAVALELASRSLAARRARARACSTASSGVMSVADVAEVQARRRARSGVSESSSSPQRQPRVLGPEVPERVEHRRGGEVHDALLRARASGSGCRPLSARRTRGISRDEVAAPRARRAAPRAARPRARRRRCRARW